MSATSDADAASVRTVLVVDDSAFMRKLIVEMINDDPRFHVAGIARDGVDAMAQVHRLDPDIVTLDLEMPKLDGLAVLTRLMSGAPRPIVVLSAGGAHYGDATLRALELGAVDFVRKPSGPVSLDLPVIRDRLIAALLAASRANVVSEWARAAPHGAATAQNRSGRTRERAQAGTSHIRGSQEQCGTRIEARVRAATHTAPAVHAVHQPHAQHLVVVASSTGGPRALAQIIPMLPAALGAAVVVAQHLPAEFTPALADRLSRVSAMRVCEADDDMELLAGTVYIARGGVNSTIVALPHSVVIRQHDVAGRGVATPSADVLFTSAAAAFGSHCTGVVLTGMGRDGSAGLRRIRAAGGQAIVQDEASCSIYGMPRAALAEAGADEIASLSMIAGTISRMVPEGRVEWLMT